MTLQDAIGSLRRLAERAPERPGRVRLSCEGQVARLVLDNPGARNALTLGMMVQLAEAVGELGRFPGAAVVLSGAGGAFCSGGHLEEVGSSLADPALGAEMGRAMTVVCDSLWNLPLVSVAAVDGAALGGGAELAFACDHRVGTPTTRVGFVHARLGVAPGWGGAARLVRHLGAPAALQALWEATPLGAEDALQRGLLDRVGEGPAEVVAEAWLEPLRKLPSAAVRAVKTQVAAARALSPGARAVEAAAFAGVWGGPDHLEALKRWGGGR